MKSLKKYNFFPAIISSIPIKNIGYCLMENLLGPDPEKLFNFENYKFDTITILNIAKDLLYSLSILKKENIIHGDLKPNNY